MATLAVEVKSDLLPWQESVLSQAKRFNVLAKGRRTGGTSLVEDLMVDLAAHGWPIGWLSVSDKLLYESWCRFVDALSEITSYRSEKNHRLELYGGGLIECWSCQSEVTTRSRKYKAVGVDEAAHVPHFKEIWERELRASLMDLRGGAWFPSSPNGLGYYYEIWLKGQDPEAQAWASWQIPTTANPLISPDEIEDMKQDLSELSFRQEVLAEFVAMEGQVFADFSRDRHVRKVSFDPALEVALGFDFGYRTAALVAAQVDKQETLRIFADAEWRGLSTAQSIARIKAFPWASRITLIAVDPAGAAVNLQSGIDDVRLFREAFPTARVIYSTDPRHRSPEWRASRIRDLLWSAAGRSRVVVDEDCKATIRMLIGSVYPPARPGSGEKAEPVKDGILDHIRDGLGFLVVNRFHRAPAEMGGQRPW